MQIETWYYIKEIDNFLEDKKVYEVFMYKEDGRYTKLVENNEEEAGIGYQSICEFPYRLYKDKDHVMKRFRYLVRKERNEKYCGYKFKTDELSGMSEFGIDHEIVAVE